MGALRPCVLCGSHRWQPVLTSDDNNMHAVPGVFHLGRCLECGLRSLNPPPSPETLSRAYAKGYGPHAAREVGKGGRLPKFWSTVALRPGARVLDVGCGGGRYLDRLRNTGVEVWGIEPDPAAAEAVRAQGFQVHTGTVEDAPYPPPAFDVVSLVHVIEHVPDPIHTLKQLPRFLRKGGRIMLLTPNIASWTFRLFREKWYALDSPRHLHLFDPSTLALACRRAGLRVVKWSVHRNSLDIRHSFERCGRPWLRALGLSKPGRSVVRWILRWASIFFRDGEELRMVVTADGATEASPQGDARTV